MHCVVLHLALESEKPGLHVEAQVRIMPTLQNLSTSIFSPADGGLSQVAWLTLAITLVGALR
jgi:hypothetical protein